MSEVIKVFISDLRQEYVDVQVLETLENGEKLVFYSKSKDPQYRQSTIKAVEEYGAPECVRLKDDEFIGELFLVRPDEEYEWSVSDFFGDVGVKFSDKNEFNVFEGDDRVPPLYVKSKFIR